MRNQFYSWIDDGDVPVLAIDGPIDTGEDWYTDAVTPKAFREALERYAGRNILVSINSPGGDVFAGFEIYNMLASRRGGVTVRVVGLAASAASYIAMAADPGQLQMCQASMMMIHNPWTVAMGDADKLRGQAQVLDEISAIMADIYMQRATCTEDELRAMLAAERYLSPTEAMACGLCDAIVNPFEENGEEERAAAALCERYAAMSLDAVRGIRDGLTIGVHGWAACRPPAPGPEAAPAAPQDEKDYLAMADALIADMK